VQGLTSQPRGRGEGEGRADLEEERQKSKTRHYVPFVPICVNWKRDPDVSPDSLEVKFKIIGS